MEESREYGVVYSEEIQSAIERIGMLSAEMDHASYFSLYNDIIPALYNHLLDYDISLNTFRLVWQMLNRIVVAGNFVWFKQYWSWSVQYETFKFNGERRSEPYKRFYFFHVMTGALLCFNKRYDWLTYTLFFTMQLPERFGLVPNTFQEIMDVAEIIYYRKEQPFFFESHFEFDGMASCARNDSIIVSEAYDYLALLMIRLWSLGYNVSFADPLTLPQLDPINIDRNNALRRIAGMLKGKVHGWYAKDRIDKVEFRFKPFEEEVVRLLEEFDERASQLNSEIYEKAELDTTKVDRLKENLQEAAKRHSNSLPLQKDSELKVENAMFSDYRLENHYKLDKDVLIAGSNVSYTNMPDVLVSTLTYQAISYYEMFFMKAKAKHSYKIKYEDIGKAIDRLSLTTNHIILSFGEYIDNKIMTIAPIINVASRMSCIIIMHKQQLPYTKYVTEKLIDRDMDDILPDSVHLYSNIGHMERDNILKIVQYIRIYSSKEPMNYIRLDVDHFSIREKFDVEKIEPIEI